MDMMTLNRRNATELPAMLTPVTPEVSNPHQTVSSVQSMDEVHERIEADDRRKWDVVLPRRQLQLSRGRLLFPDAPAYECDAGLGLSDWALSQLCVRLQMPTSYFRRCPHALQDEQFNWWIGQESRPRLDAPHEDGNGERDGGDEMDDDPFAEPPAEYSDDTLACEPESYRNGYSNGSGHGHVFHEGRYHGPDTSERWLLRAKGTTLRAVLTDKYVPLDNRTLLDALRRSLPSRLQVQWFALDDASLHLRLFDPLLVTEVEKGDPLMAGLHLSNSEVGGRSVTVDAVVYRQVCTNGMIALHRGKSILQQRHVAIAKPHFIVLLREALQQALTTAGHFVQSMCVAARHPLADMEVELKRLGTRHHLSQEMVERVRASLFCEEKRHQETLFGLVNALTRAAQELPADRRYEVEVLAGRLLRHPLEGSEESRANGNRRQSQTMVVPAVIAETTHDAVQAAREMFDARVVTSTPLQPTLSEEDASEEAETEENEP